MSTAVEATWHDDVLVLRVSGELDLYGADHLRRTLSEASADRSHGRVIVDLTGIAFIDSAGLGVLVGAQKTLRSRGRELGLVVTSGDVLRALRISSLTRLFVLHDTVGAGLTASRAVTG